MICRRLVPLVLATVLAASTASAAPAPWVAAAAAAAEIVPSNYKYASMSAGLRNSFTLGSPGLDFRLGIGGFWGLFGMEIETGWTADRTWMALENRSAARTTTWIGPQLWVRPKPKLALSFGVSPGLGWIKDPSDQTEPHPRHASFGIREYVQVGFFIGSTLGFFQLGLRLEMQHLTQAGIVEGSEHALCLRLVMALGEVRPIDELGTRDRPRRGR